jgi:hypothetical protein
MATAAAISGRTMSVAVARVAQFVERLDRRRLPA